MIDEKKLAEIRARLAVDGGRPSGVFSNEDALRLCDYAMTLLAALDESRATCARLCTGLMEISNERYKGRNAVTPEKAFDAFRELNAHACAIYDKAEALALSVVPGPCKFCGKVGGHNAICRMAEPHTNPICSCCKAPLNAHAEWCSMGTRDGSATLPPDGSRGGAYGAKRTAADVLAEGAATFRERRKIYGDNYLKVGSLLATLYPAGLALRTPDDFSRFELFMFMLVKLSRFSNSGLTHTDSVHDAAVYGAMLEVLTTSRRVGEEE